jgi:hypothetical protein
MRPVCWISLAILLSLIATAIVSFGRCAGPRHRKSFYLLPRMILAAFPLTIAIGEFFAALSLAGPTKLDHSC